MNATTPPPGEVPADAPPHGDGRPVSYLGTLAGCGVVLLLTLRPGTGFMLVFPLLVLVPWWAVSAVLAVVRPAGRRARLVRMALWTATVALVVGAHEWQDRSTRRAAQEIADLVERHVAAHGACPTDLASIGESMADLRERLGRRGIYACDGGRPTLSYASSWDPFDRWLYDFSSRRWEFLPD